MPAAGQTTKPLVALPRDPAACWVWQARADAGGYPVKQWHGRTISGAYWLWEQLFGPVPKGQVLIRTCGTRACVSPHHLKLGYQADANRAGAGTTLTPGDVLEIRAVDKKNRRGDVAHRLAENYGVSVQLIRDVWAKRAWGARQLRKSTPPPSSLEASA